MKLVARQQWTLVKDVPLVGEPEIWFISLTGTETTSVRWILEYINSSAGSGFDYAGLQHAERLLRVQQLLPYKLRGKCLLFPGTVLSDNGGNNRIPLIYWKFDSSRQRWVLNFPHTDIALGNFRLVLIENQ